MAATAYMPSGGMKQDIGSSMEDLDPSKLNKVHDFVDDDLLSCFLWAAGENAITQPGWESPSQNPLKGIPLPPSMPPLPAAAPSTSANAAAAVCRAVSVIQAPGVAGMPHVNVAMTPPPDPGRPAPEDLDDLGGLDDDDIADISQHISGQGIGGTLSKEQKLTQRMQRKAESARVARLRKKEYVSGLEAEIAKLKAENDALRVAGAAAGAAAPPTEGGGLKLQGGDEGKRQLSQMDELLRRPGVDNMAPEVNATVEKYVANRRVVQETINEYLDCIEDILSPGAPLQAALTAASATGQPTHPAVGAAGGAALLSTANPPSTAPGPLATALSEAPAPADPAAAGAAASEETPLKVEEGVLLAAAPPPVVEAAAPPPPPPEPLAAETVPAGLVPPGEAVPKQEEPSEEGDEGGEQPVKRQRRESVGSQLLETLSTELGLTASQVGNTHTTPVSYPRPLPPPPYRNPQPAPLNTPLSPPPSHPHPLIQPSHPPPLSPTPGGIALWPEGLHPVGARHEVPVQTFAIFFLEKRQGEFLL